MDWKSTRQNRQQETMGINIIFLRPKLTSINATAIGLEQLYFNMHILGLENTKTLETKILT